ncbi:MAG TPA: hypothetical protein VMN04_11350 [Thermoanaerobaculia bacterium]|nr:hypothetical protein [Thermoanaerobaculia bacterium]
MRNAARATTLALLLGVLLSAPLRASKSPSKKGSHAQIVAVCRVESPPAAKRHRNHRRFLEFDVTILSFARVAGDAEADPDLPVRRDRPIHVIHDLSCGGRSLDLAPGDAVEIRGEYVAVPGGGDLIHFTHAADGSCGPAGTHPDGGIRKLDASALKKAA